MPPRTGLYLVAVALLFAAALCGALLATSHEPPVVAPINPTGDAAHDLYLRP